MSNRTTYIHSAFLVTVIVKNKVHYDIFPSVGSQRLQQSVPVSSLTFHLVAIVLSSLIIATIKNIGLEHIYFCAYRFCLASSYYGISFNITGLGLSIYLTQFVYSLIELPAKGTVYYLLDKIGRRPTQMGALLCAAICLGINLIMPKGKPGVDTSSDLKVHLCPRELKCDVEICKQWSFQIKSI